jgi:cation diffusion facilitator CzcD-associated flavoprotein CzcO
VQLVPRLARTARVTLFQRTPAWIVPRGGGDYSEGERAEFAAHPDELARLRAALYAEGEARFASRSGDAAASAEAQAVALRHLEALVPDPVLRAALTPDYAFGCKRVLLSDDFYPALSSGAVTLEPSALVGVEGSTVIAASGARHEVDALVLATGFASTRQPYADLVHGEQGTLAEHWSGGMTSFASTAVSGFPSMFVLDGPNAALGHSSSVLMIEEQVAYAVRCLAHRDVMGRPLRVDPAAEAAYTDEIAVAAASTPWMTGGCRNWYVDERSGRLTLLWPGTVAAYRARLARADGTEFGSSADLGEQTNGAPAEGARRGTA